MAFEQKKLDRAVDQSRGIFDIFIYESDTDTVADIQAAGYFDRSRFLEESPDEWYGGLIKVKAADGYFEGIIEEGAGVDGVTGASKLSVTAGVKNVSDQNYTVQDSDNGLFLNLSFVGLKNLDVDLGIDTGAGNSVGFNVWAMDLGGSGITLTGSTAPIRHPQGHTGTTGAQYEVISLISFAADEYRLGGETA